MNGWKVFLSAMSLAVTVACSSEQAMSDVVEEKGKSVETVLLEDSVLVSKHSYRGQLEPIQEVNLSFEASGTVQQIFKQKGDPVVSGDVIAVLDDREAQLAYDRAVTQVNQAQASYDQAKQGADSEELRQSQLTISQLELKYEQLVDEQLRLKKQLETNDIPGLTNLLIMERNAKEALERANQLFSDGLISQVELDRAKTDLERVEEEIRLSKRQAEEEIDRLGKQIAIAKQDIAKAESQYRLVAQDPNPLTIEQAKANYEQAVIVEQDAMLQLEKRKLSAPDAGVILESSLAVGELSSPNQAAVTIGDISTLKASFLIPVAEKEKWQIGSVVTVDYRGDVKEGKTTYISPVVKEGTSMITIEVEILNSDGSWLAGDYVKVAQASSEMKGFYVPASAILETKERYLYVVEEDVVKRVAVEVGMPIGKFVEVFPVEDGELEQGMNVVVGGMDRIQEGDQVTMTKGERQ